MIKRLILKNFESHVDTDMSFDKGVTIISGNSSQGKSGIFRALRFAMLNLSEGEDSINYNADECSVELHYDDHTIKRVRSKKGKNEYYLDGMLYKAFGQSVPVDIQRILNLNPINFEWQFDKRPFLLSETGGYIASKLNEIVDLELIDKSLKSIESERRSSKREKENIEKQITDIKPKIDDFNWIETAEKELENIVKLEKSVKNNNVLIENLTELHENYAKLLVLHGKLNVLSDRDIDIVANNVETYEKLNTDYDVLVSLCDSFLRFVKEYNEVKTIDDIQISNIDSLINEFDTEQNNLDLMKTTYFAYKDISEQINDIGNTLSDRKIERLEKEVESYNMLEKQIVELEQIQRSYKRTSSQIKLITDELESLKEEYKEVAPDTCPLCGSILDKELI